MAFTNPTIADFKAKFFRDFPYGTTFDTVQDQDITNALNSISTLNFNTCLFGFQADYTLAYLLLAAHYLVLNLRASSQGIAGQYDWMITGKGVGSVNESIQIPDRILSNPLFAMLSRTPYGAAYLEMMLPMLAGNAVSVRGHTHA